MGFFEKSNEFAIYFITLVRFPKLFIKEFLKFRKVFRFKIEKRLLFGQNSKNVPMKRIIDNYENLNTIIKFLHDKSGHKSKIKIYHTTVDRY